MSLESWSLGTDGVARKCKKGGFYRKRDVKQELRKKEETLQKYKDIYCWAATNSSKWQKLAEDWEDEVNNRRTELTEAQKNLNMQMRLKFLWRTASIIQFALLALSLWLNRS